MFLIARETVQVTDFAFEIFVCAIMNGVDLIAVLNYVLINVVNLTGEYANKVDVTVTTIIQE
jgi:hypothetical protein